MTKREIVQALLAQLFHQRGREVAGNDNLVIGTVDRADWKRGVTGTITTQEMIQALHDFKDVVQFKPMGGWRRDES